MIVFTFIRNLSAIGVQRFPLSFVVSCGEHCVMMRLEQVAVGGSWGISVLLPCPATSLVRASVLALAVLLGIQERLLQSTKASSHKQFASVHELRVGRT